MQRPETESRHGSAPSKTSQVQASPNLALEEGSFNTDRVFLSSDGTECFVSAANTLSSASPLAHKDRSDTTVLSQEAIQVLLNSFTNLQVNEIDDHSPPKTSDLFYLPEESAANSLARQVHDVLSYGNFMFLMPGIHDIEQALLNPTGAEPRGRVLLANHILHAISASLDADSTAAKAFCWNVHAALNDATLFLKPCEENLQALFTLAVHGEDRFACPNLSWMLVGQATQQAKAIGLHLPRPGAESDYQRRLSLFWSLFIVDKSVSLAFGRPEFLEAAHYQSTPLPDSRHLDGFSPHAGKGQASTSNNGFGRCFFLSNVALAKYISRYNNSIRRGSWDEAQAFRQDLELWFEQTTAELDTKMKAETNLSDASIKEMEMGIRTLKFQFFHLVVMLLRNLGAHEERACAISRMGLSMLPGLVSNSSGVYNGIVWQLLYYPFTPFLVLFQRLLHCDVSARSEEDLQLMEGMVSYYVDMSHNLGPLQNLASKLGETAQVFFRLAKQISDQKKQPNIGTIQYEEVERFFNSYLIMRSITMDTQVQPTTNAWPTEQISEPMRCDTVEGIDWFSWETHDVPIFPFV